MSGDSHPNRFSLSPNYPNPFNASTTNELPRSKLTRYQRNKIQSINYEASFGELYPKRLNVYKQTEVGRYREVHGDYCTECHDDLNETVDLSPFRAPLDQSAAIFDQSLAALIEGGEAPDFDDQTVALPSTQEDEILEKIAFVQSEWESFYQNVTTVLEADQTSLEFQEAVDYIEANAGSMMEKVDVAVLGYEEASERKFAQLKTVLWIILIAGLCLSAGGILIGNKMITRPIVKMVNVAKRIAEGDFSEEVEVTQTDEIGTLEKSLGEMVDGLNHLISEVKS